MKIREIRCLQGANFWSKKPVVRMLLDMEEQADLLSNQIPGFIERLLLLVPSLKERRDSAEERGSLVERLQQGAPLHHAVGHMASELQCLAAMNTTFCKTVPTKDRGIFQVVYDYWVPEAGIFAGEEALRLVEGIVNGVSDEELDVGRVIHKIKRICADRHFGPSAMAIADEARRRGITVIRIDDYGLVQLGAGKYQKRIRDSLTSATSLIAAETASNKKLARMILANTGIPVGVGLSTGLPVGADRPETVAEKGIPDNSFRVLVIDGKLVAAARCTPAREVDQGGEAADVTHKLHPANKAICERAARIIGLDIAGIDIIAPTLETPITDNGGAVIAVNAAPDLGMHLKPAAGQPQNVAAAVLDMLFPPGSPHEIPIVSITGSSGKTTTVRLVSHILASFSTAVGMTTTDGLVIRGRQILEGDMGGPRSARLILQDPTVDCAVFETAGGELLRNGLGYGTADVGVCLNVSEDRVGLGYIETCEDLAKLKSLVPESVRRGGHAVLNADDRWCREMAARCSEKIIWFSLNPRNPVIMEHAKKGGVAVVYQNGYITILAGELPIPVAQAYEVPITLEGKAHFNIQNALAATAVALALNVRAEEIKDGLSSFFPSPSQAPGRLNVIPIKEFEVLVDSAHTPTAFVSLFALITRLNSKRRLLVIDAAGDRGNEEIEQLARLASPHADEVIIYEGKDLRGRQSGETASVLKKGFEKAGHAGDRMAEILDEFEAIDHALKMAAPGDLVIVLTGSGCQAIRHVYQCKDRLDPLTVPSSPGQNGNR